MNILLGKDTYTHQTGKEAGSIKHELNILLLEHSEDNAKSINTILKDKGVRFVLKSVDSSKDFAKALHQFEPEIIIADCIDSPFSGLKAVQFLKKNKIDIPIIIIADAETEKTAIKCVKEGAYDYLLKKDLSFLDKYIYPAIGITGEDTEPETSVTGRFNYNKIYEYLLDTLGQANTGFLIINSSSKEILFVNEAFCNMCQYEAEDIYRLTSLLELINKKNPEDFQKEIMKVLQPDKPIHIFNSVLVRKDNKNVNVEFTARQFTMNDSSEIILIARDVTKLINKTLLDKLREEALQESERLYRSMIENVKDYAIFMLDYTGRIIKWNAGAERVFGYAENEIIMKNFEIIFPDKKNNSINASGLLQQTKLNGNAEAELQLFRRDGKKFWALITITRLDNHNSETGILSVIIYDLTKNKISEEQLHEQEVQLRSLAKHLQDAREEERLRIARELHDEFSQMLTVLRMDLSVLSHSISRTISEPLKRISLMEKISSISDLLEKTIRSTRRIITELRPAVLDELGLFTAIQWQAQEFENRTGIRCKIIKLAHEINFDRNTSTAIFRILQEGLTNVAKHSGATSVVISLNFNNDELHLEIKDNGKGIDDGKLKAPTSTGLLGIRERVMAFNGNFEIQSEKGNGTRLIVSVPFKEEK